MSATIRIGQRRNSQHRKWTALVAVVIVFAALTIGVRPAAAVAAGKSVTRLSQLKNAPIPASCEHKATRLHGYSKDFGTYDGSAALDTRHVAFVALKGGKRKYAVLPLVCNAGGVGWPEVLLVYSAGPRLVGSADLGRLRTAQEHEDVTRLAAGKRRVHVAWEGYEGAGFSVSTYTGTLSLSRGRGKVKLRHTGPLTIDYTASDGQSEPSFGPGIYNGSGDAADFYPAAKSFTTFVAHRYNGLSSKYGSYGTAVRVMRLSHRGFAFAAESMGWESVVLYGKVKGSWAVLGNWGDGPECSSLSPLQRRGLTATHGFCFSSGGGVTNLGSWPRSGQ